MVKLLVLSLLVALTSATPPHSPTHKETKTHKASSLGPVFPAEIVNPGDFVYFYHSKDQAGCSDAPKHADAKNEAASARKNAIVACSVVEKSIFHVGMMVSATEMVHATTEGVKKELLTEAIKSHKPNEVELTSVNLDEDWKNAAVEWANKEIGADYNDIFSPDFINSKAKRSFYCCQFVQEAYKQTKPDDQEDAFPEHKLNFKDKDGKLIDHFKKHYEEKNLPIPQGEKGSHPSKQHTAAFIKHVETVKIVN